MTSRPPAFVRLVQELRRRRVFTTAGLYVVGAWLVMQAADVFFPGWGLPDTGINVLLLAAIFGFPLALVFGWLFNITTQGIMRTMPSSPESAGEPRPLKGNDFIILGTLGLVAGVIIAYTTVELLGLREPAPPVVEKLENSIAVLPFENLSTDPGNEVFSDGVSEEIRNRLGKYGELQVIARTSSDQFKGNDYGISRISDLLGVRYLVQGSVRRQGDRIRVTAQLVADKGTQMWSENYDRVLEDVFGIQDEIADLVATEVAPKILAGLKDSYRPSLDAYKHYLAGRELLHRRDKLAAQQELAKAVELDPGYAEAYAEYAISLVIYGLEEKEIQQADVAIEAALTLAPGLPRALAARGLYLINQYPRDVAAQEAVLREALKGDPNMVDAMNWLSITLDAQGRRKEADEWQDRAYARDPFNGAIAVNMAHRVWEDGNPERAESMLRRLIEFPDPPFSAFEELCSFYSATGRLVEANKIAKRLLLAGSWKIAVLAENYARLGSLEAAEYWMARMAHDYPELLPVRIGWVQAQVPFWLGGYGQAAIQIDKALMSSGLSMNQVTEVLSDFYGMNQALSGDYAAAIDVLEEALPSARRPEVIGGMYEVNAYQALAWAFSHSGMPELARQRLETVERWFFQNSGAVEMVTSTNLYEAARNAVLMDDTELALERLERAVAAGWREYYVNIHDPRWGALKDDPRYQALMAEVKADVDRQRALVEGIDVEEDFPTLLDQVRESDTSTAGEDAGER